MKKVFMVIGVIFTVIVIGLFVLNHFGSKLDVESDKYVDTTIKNIITDWNSQALINNASVELLQVASKAELTSFIQSCSSKFGPLKHYRGAKGQANISLGGQGMIISGRYLAKADFHRASAGITMSVIKHGKRWYITEFRVNSDIFLE